ncbi:MAG: tryptophan synthase subunit beta [Pseudomonadota bacterium]
MTLSAVSSPAPSFWAEQPDPAGRFGEYGGRFVPETLMPALAELTAAFKEARRDPDFRDELDELLAHYVGRPTPLYEAKRLAAQLGGARIFLKREDLAHTGAHKINNALGQALLARRMGKTRLIAETGAGQHGVATATAAALLGLECTVFMGALDIERQALNVTRMRMLGATVEPVTGGGPALKAAVNQALREWVGRVADSHYIIGSVIGPHPYPLMVRDFQAVIGREARGQVLARAGRLPDALMACVGAGSNALGLFHPFLADRVRMVGVEAAGKGRETGLHALSLGAGQPGVLHGCRQYLLQDPEGQIIEAHSIAAGLDYPGVGPEHGLLKDLGRVEYLSATDDEAVAALMLLSRKEGIICALESAHAIAQALKLAPAMARDAILLICLSGRGDKDVAQLAGLLED